MYRYVQGTLHAISANKQKSIAEIVRSYKHPVYIYDIDALTERADIFQKQMPNKSKSFFAMKSNNNANVLKVLKKCSFGVDVVSMGEMKVAMKSGFTTDEIIFSGVGKTKEELSFAIEENVLQLNIESIPELKRIIEISKQKNKKANVAIRINPDVEAKTHPYISTGFKENKFGVDLSQISDFLSLIKENQTVLNFRGITMHVGSQIRDVSVFEESIKKAMKVYKEIQSQGFEISVVDIGGGVGIDYQSDGSDDTVTIQKYAQALKTLTQDFSGQLLFEPGRIIVARIGILVAEVQYVKVTPHKKFVILNTGMNHLMRPALYQAYHRILPIEKSGDALDLYDVVGPICESTDTLGFDRELPNTIKEGDWVAIMDAGAYGHVMSSNYNCHHEAQEIVI
jgi:diaminopimelate decarboxylase